MAPSVKHTFVSPIPDGGDPTIVGPNAWNADHTLLGVQGAIALTTTGTSGASTFDGTTLNVPVYAFADTGITQLTADVLAGPGNGSQAATVVALNGTNLAALATGFLVNTTGTGVPTIKTAPTSLVVGTSDTQTLTNKNLAGAGNVFPTFNQNTTGSAAKWTTARLLAGNSVDGSANVAFANKFIVQGTVDTGLSGAQFLGALTTGIVKNTTTTGVLSIATGADLPVMTATVGGAVPTPPNNTTMFLRGDGTFAAPTGGSGTVTHTVGALTANAVVLGNGAADITVLGSLGTTTTVLHGNVAGAPSFGAVSLTADVSGVLPIANGGTGNGTGNAATVTTNANLTGPITSVGNATSIASQTGTGSKFVVDTGPTISALTATGTTTPTGLVDVSGAGAGQIKFPATQNPSANANTLDDYSEGTWTPAFSATSSTFSYATQEGFYVKIGKLVFIRARISLNTTGNTLTANSLSVTGLPFTSGTLAAGNWAPMLVNWSFSTVSYVQMVASISSASTVATIAGITAAAASSAVALNASNALSTTGGSVISFNGTYMAAN